MHNQIIIECGNDSISIKDILNISIQTATEITLKEIEEKYNGKIIQYQKKHNESSYTNYELTKKVEDILNKYQREFSYQLFKAHYDFDPFNNKSYFNVRIYNDSEYIYAPNTKYTDNSCIHFLHEQLVEKNIESKYKRENENVGWYVNHKRIHISLKKDILPLFEKVLNCCLNLEYENHCKNKIKERYKNHDNRWLLTWLHTDSKSSSNIAISNEAKKEIKEVYNELNKYYSAIDEENSCYDNYKKRQEEYDHFVEIHMDEEILTIETAKITYHYLSSICGFDILAKKQEIEACLLECRNQRVNQIQKIASDNCEINTNFQNFYLNEDECISVLDVVLYTDEPIMYKGHKLSREDDTIVYGNEEDPFEFFMDLPSISLTGMIDNKSKNLWFIVALKEKKTDKIIRSKGFAKDFEWNMQQAFNLGVSWFKKALEEYDKEKEIEKQNNSNNQGEKNVEYAIKWFIASNKGKGVFSIANNCESRYRYNCILLQNSEYIDEAQEYDHILVTPAGVVLIETKDWRGTIDITLDGKWIRHKEDAGDTFGVASPIMQIRRHKQLMNSILPTVPVYSILCFSNSSAIINGKENITECMVINIDQLEMELNQICTNSNYSDEQINEIVAKIEACKINQMK